MPFPHSDYHKERQPGGEPHMTTTRTHLTLG